MDKKKKSINILMTYAKGIAMGIIVGLLTLIGQKYLPSNFNFSANSGAIWLVPAFLISFYENNNKKHSVLVCMLCLLFCVYGYYGFEALINNHSFFFDYYIVLWSVCAVVGGIIFGLGAYFANNADNFLKYCSMNLLPAVFIAEGINKVIHIEWYMHIISAIIMVTSIGVILYFIVNRKHSFKVKNIVSLLIITSLGIAGYEVVFALTI